MKKLGVFLLLIVFAQMVCGAHYISGWAQDALDGEMSDGKDVVMWNPLAGVSDNLTDVVGVSGNSGVSGVYMMDCEFLGAGCLIGDILSLKIFGENYVSWIVNVTVSGAGYDTVENLSLNSPPNVSLVFPDGDDVLGSVDFNCSFFDYDENVENVSLWGNWSGAWIEEASIESGFENDYVIFNDILVQGSYEWNCYVQDDLGIGSFDSNNNSFFVDTTAPVIWDVSSVSSVCGFGSIPVDCNVSDNRGIEGVIIRSISPSSVFANYSAGSDSGDIYRANIDLDEVGDWTVECFANDSVGNLNYSVGEDVEVGSGLPELSISGGVVAFDVDPSVEGEIVNVSVNVSNSGCVASGDFDVGFYDGENSFENLTVSIGAKNSLNVSALWSTDIGLSEIFVYADLNEDVVEDNESNNVASDFVYLKAWQGIYGNLSLNRVLGKGEVNMSFWASEESFMGSVFVSDSEAILEWNSLQAIGLTKTGTSSSGDLGEIDSILGMGSYNDSVSAVYASSSLGNLSIFQSEIEDVPFINSSGNGNFATGILWDMSDSSDLEYDSSEGEDIVFVAKVNRGMAGSYGVYDYEILVPSKLRGYDSGDVEKVYLYYDLN